MSSEAQITANRINAQKSTGPRTAEGKTTVSQNALTHGLSSNQDVISNEDPAEFNLHRDQLLAELKPLGPMETMLADRVVSLSWRLKRAVSIQNQAINILLNPPPPHPLSKLADSLVFKMNGLPEPESTPPDPSLALGRAFIKDLAKEKVLERLLMYERRIEHSLFKTITELQRLTLLRKMNPPDKPPEDVLRPSGYLAPSFTGGPKTEHPNPLPRATSPESRATIMQNKANFTPTPSPERTYAQHTASANPANKPEAEFALKGRQLEKSVKSPLGVARPRVIRLRRTSPRLKNKSL